MTDDWLARHGGRTPERASDHRSPFQRDRARILHSAAFRRLQAKTQVHGVGSNDFYRTRLTHSLEVAQIGGGILAQVSEKSPELLNRVAPNPALIESLCLAHDIGHPPFGHGGEIALHYMMREHGGFEGNGQTFRIISKLEPYTEHYGMNLTRRTVLGLVKYPALFSQIRQPDPVVELGNENNLKASLWHPPKGIYDDDVDVFDWLLSPLTEADREAFISARSIPNKHHKTKFKSFDCSMMELADDIAYGIHDLEDAIVMGIVAKEQFENFAVPKLKVCGNEWAEENIGEICDKLFDKRQFVRKDAIGALVNALITRCNIFPVSHKSDIEFEHPLLAYNVELCDHMDALLDVFKRFVSQYVIQKPELQLEEFKGQQIVMNLFKVFASEPQRLLPEVPLQQWVIANEHGESGHRVIADFISGMTDEYAMRLYRQLFGSGTSAF